MDASSFSKNEQAQLERLINQKQMKDFMNLYGGLVERCFNTCCNDFTTKALTGKEEECTKLCTDKFLAHSNRVGARFAEKNAENMSQGLGATTGQ